MKVAHFRHEGKGPVVPTELLAVYAASSTTHNYHFTQTNSISSSSAEDRVQGTYTHSLYTNGIAVYTRTYRHSHTQDCTVCSKSMVLSIEQPCTLHWCWAHNSALLPLLKLHTYPSLPVFLTVSSKLLDKPLHNCESAAFSHSKQTNKQLVEHRVKHEKVSVYLT